VRCASTVGHEMEDGIANRLLVADPQHPHVHLLRQVRCIGLPPDAPPEERLPTPRRCSRMLSALATNSRLRVSKRRLLFLGRHSTGLNFWCKHRRTPCCSRMPPELRPSHRVKAWIKTRRLCLSQVLRNAINRIALYSLRLAAAHVHCARPLAARNGKFGVVVGSL
jgi:hypothetical protein